LWRFSSRRYRGPVHPGAATRAASERLSLPPAVVADANVILSALIGGRARLVIASAHGPKCVAADAVAAEISRHIPRLAERRGLDQALLYATLLVMRSNGRQRPSTKINATRP